MEKSTQRNNLLIYGNATRPDGPAMTWAMHAIAQLDIDDVVSDRVFRDTYERYMRQPFYTWTEAATGYQGTNSFITGAGGFLQLILNGYAGIRLHDEYLEIRNSQLPPYTGWITINGMFKIHNNYTKLLIYEVLPSAIVFVLIIINYNFG